MQSFSFFSNNIVGGDFITFKYRYRKQILVGAVILVALIALGIFLIINYKPKNKKDSTKLLVTKKVQPKKKENFSNEKLYKVDIKGEILNPGIYSCNPSSRVIDVIEKAGGLTANANTTVINLSKKIIDEMVIIVYSNDEVNDFKKTKEMEQQIQNQCIQKDENSLKNDACITTNTDTNITKISINTATLEQLTTLSGIGEEKAKDIISYREQNGQFKTLEDLKNVSGIGDALFAKIKDNITL